MYNLTLLRYDIRMTSYVVYQGDQEWSALYVDGKLDKVGDHYLIDERIRALFGVSTICSNSFLLGGNYYVDVAQHQADIYYYDLERASVQRAADALFEEAARLHAEAEALLTKSSQ